MTLLMVNLKLDGVDIVTDTLGHAIDYSFEMHTSKVLVLPHVDVVMAFSGSERVRGGLFALAAAGELGSSAEQIVGATTTLFPALAADEVISPTLELDDVQQQEWRGGHLVVVGPNATGNLEGALLFGDPGTPPQRLEGGTTFIQPATADSWAATVEDWAFDNDQEVIGIAARVRDETMARPPGRRGMIGGRLIRTIAGVGFAQQRTIAQFDDSDEVWARYLDGMPVAAAKWAARERR